MIKDLKDNKLALFFVMFMGFVAGYMYYSQFTSSEPVIDSIVIKPDDTLKKFSGLRLDFTLLEQDSIKALQQFGEPQVNAETEGKKNIFSDF